MTRAAGLCVLVAVVALSLGNDTYPNKYDDVNIRDIINNDRLLNKYRECLNAPTDTKCPEDGKFLRSILAEGLATDCAKCNEKQRAQAMTGAKMLIQTKPDIWKEIETKYDPSGSFLEKHPELKS